MPRLSRTDYEALTPVGLWRPSHIGLLTPASADLPDPTTFVDENWELEERQRIASLLAGAEVIARYRGFSRCRICNASNGSTELSDGVYRWPSGLGHYVLEHAVRLPGEFLTHLTASPATP